MPDAGTVVATELNTTADTIRKVKLAWTSSAGGAADKQTTGTFSGKIERLVTVPGAGGVQPTNLYDITLLDDDGNDVLMGAGADRSNVNTEQVLSTSLGICAKSKLYLHVTNAGNAKSGTVFVYLR